MVCKQLKLGRAFWNDHQFFRNGMLNTLRLIEIHMIGSSIHKNHQIILYAASEVKKSYADK